MAYSQFESRPTPAVSREERELIKGLFSQERGEFRPCHDR